MEKKPLIVIVGPTASGKTAVSIELAKKYDGEIVSADSMQIYKGMDIATAKPTINEMQRIPHHLISELKENTSFSVADYVKLAKKSIDEIYSRGKIPVLVGGTGLYINSLVDNIAFDNTSSNKEIRDRLTLEAKQNGNSFLLNKLMQIDKETAITLHENNLTRIIRAIEYFEITGEKLSVQNIRSRENESIYNTCFIGLNYSNRQDLYDRINIRVDKMLEDGLLTEAKEVFHNKELATACQAIGYKELIPYFNSEKTLEECVNYLKQQSRRYAKRQLTWFRRDVRINWIEIANKNIILNDIIEKATTIIDNTGILINK